MPKRLIDDETPRRRTGGAAMVPGLLLRAAMYSPKDFVAGTVAFAAICTIVGNAIFMQTGRHPSPIFGTPSWSEATTPMVSNPLPRPRPPEAAQTDKPLDSRLFDAKPAETRPQPKAESRPEKAELRAADPPAGLIRNASAQRPAPAANPNVPRPPAPVPSRDPLGDLISGQRGR